LKYLKQQSGRYFLEQHWHHPNVTINSNKLRHKKLIDWARQNDVSRLNDGYNVELVVKVDSSFVALNFLQPCCRNANNNSTTGCYTALYQAAPPRLPGAKWDDLA